MIDVFLVDDDKQYANSLMSSAGLNDISITHASDLNEMKSFLPKVASAMSLIILDIKGKFFESDENDNESFLAAAISYLDLEFPLKPRVILTGDIEGYKYVEVYRKDEKIFRKGNESEKKMFEYIKEVHANLPIYEIRKKYADVFMTFEMSQLPSVRKDELIKLIQNRDSLISSDIKFSLGRIRDFQEEIIRLLNIKKNEFLPDLNAKNKYGDISFTQSINYLEKTGKCPELITRNAVSTYKIGCSYGIHTKGSAESTTSGATVYTVNCALNSLLDLIKWYQSIIE